MKFLREHWSDVKSSARFAEFLDNVVKGVYPHAAGVLADIVGYAIVSPTGDASVSSIVAKPAAEGEPDTMTRATDPPAGSPSQTSDTKQ